LEDDAVEVDFQFDRETARTNPLGLSLVALTVNATHATVMLEVRATDARLS
jgi:tRNA (Thr-GGU) A37 N-methylase